MEWPRILNSESRLIPTALAPSTIDHATPQSKVGSSHLWLVLKVVPFPTLLRWGIQDRPHDVLGRVRDGVRHRSLDWSASFHLPLRFLPLHRVRIHAQILDPNRLSVNHRIGLDALTPKLDNP